MSVIFDGPFVVRVFLGRRLPSDSVDEGVMELFRAYFGGERVDFSRVPVRLGVSAFTEKVLDAARGIPYGKVITYGELARACGVRCYRAVGAALGRNPVPVVIPCHRVVSARGLGGYSSGLVWKRYLLELEGCVV